MRFLFLPPNSKSVNITYALVSTLFNLAVYLKFVYIIALAASVRMKEHIVLIDFLYGNRDKLDYATKYAPPPRESSWLLPR